eukprot:m.7146 g.7146  ORF g.7146 m.7146 type:complete len:152 (-) comp2713_c0_seq2:656-1111(-)
MASEPVPGVVVRRPRPTTSKWLLRATSCIGVSAEMPTRLVLQKNKSSPRPMASCCITSIDAAPACGYINKKGMQQKSECSHVGRADGDELLAELGRAKLIDGACVVLLVAHCLQLLEENGAHDHGNKSERAEKRGDDRQRRAVVRAAAGAG